MRLVLLFSCLLFLGCSVQLTQQSKSDAQSKNNALKSLIQLVFMYIELSLQYLGSVSIPINRTIPLQFLSPTLLDGTFGLQKLRISGFDSLVVNKDNINFDLEDSVFSFCINMSVPSDLKLTIANYNADIVLLDFVPVYGRGDISFGLRGLDFALCSDIIMKKPSPIQLANFVLQPYAQGLVFEIDGFWNNPEISALIRAVVQTVEKVLFFFYRDNMRCIACMLSISIENIVNQILKPTGELTDYYALGALSRTNCKDDCSFNGYPLAQKLFTIENLESITELLNFIEKDHTFRDIVLEAKDYLNEYLEEHF